LKEFGADLNLKNKPDGISGFKIAAERGFEDSVQYFLQNGA
jgi:hypothetical protein